MFKKCISILLVASQFTLSTAVFANTAPSQSALPVISPEFTLVENVIALQGEKLSGYALQYKMYTAVSSYLATAQAEGSQERFQEALVSLGIYTQAQAQSFVSDAQAANARVLAGHTVDVDQTQSLVSSEMSQLASEHLDGAQFSMSCNAADTVAEAGFGLAVTGVLTTITGLIIHYNNPTCECVAPVDQNCDPDYSSCTICTETCSQPGYHPDATEGEHVTAVGEVAIGVGALLLFFGAGGSC